MSGLYGQDICHDPSHRHVVTARKCNYSALSGYRRSPSAYSEVRCVDCQPFGKVWRTKAKYVDDLPDAHATELFGPEGAR